MKTNTTKRIQVSAEDLKSFLSVDLGIYFSLSLKLNGTSCNKNDFCMHSSGSMRFLSVMMKKNK